MNSLQGWLWISLILSIWANRRQILEGIWDQSQALSGKGKLARFLDKTRDSGAIAKLSEELRQAILVYQVGMFIGH